MTYSYDYQQSRFKDSFINFKLWYAYDAV